MDEHIVSALHQRFEKHRVVFWWDADAEFAELVPALGIDGVEVEVIDRNEFALKHRVLRAERDSKFLLYSASARPGDVDNWLLDVELAHSTFRADRTAMRLADMGLGSEFAEIIDDHQPFFASQERMERLKAKIRPEDTKTDLRLRMLEVCTQADSGLAPILGELLAEAAQGGDGRVRLVERCSLNEFLWEQAASTFDYTPDTPGLEDFALAMLSAAFDTKVGHRQALGEQAVVFVNRWRQSRAHEQSFRHFSAVGEDVLGIRARLESLTIKQLVDVDYFEAIDLRIISELASAVAARQVTQRVVADLVQGRKTGHWFHRFEPFYSAIDAAARLLELVEASVIEIESISDGVDKYTRTWHLVDREYRKYIFHRNAASSPTTFEVLSSMVERVYSNDFLLPLNDAFQGRIDEAAKWDAGATALPQRTFFTYHVAPVLAKGKKVCVVISDAMRYEIGHELVSLVQREDRFTATATAVLSTLPSYTQLGMAALLPNTDLVMGGDGSVAVDGLRSAGREGREKILAAGVRARSTAVRADRLLEQTKDERRALMRDHDVVYVYHNRIDKVGDTRETEHEVFGAAEQTLADLVTLVKRLASANATNIVVTADHGFLYQDELHESDYLTSRPAGEEVAMENPRFVIGRGLKPNPSFRLFEASEVRRDDDLQIQIPKSINRLRQRGSGFRFVHGGASLQEAVVPVVTINKSRTSDTSQVDIEILRAGSAVITTGQLAVSFYQRQAVDSKHKARPLRAAIYSQSGDLLSDVHEIPGDIENEDARSRETNLRFVLASAADDHRGEDLVLRLDERHGATSQFREYATAMYTYRRSFTSDFDF